MGHPPKWMQEIAKRAPSLQREVERQFWKRISTGITSEKAAGAVGVSQAVGTRWFRYRGGMPLFMSKPISGRYLSFAEREEITLLSVQGLGIREIARRIEHSLSTVAREIKRNAATRGGRLEYRASVAQWKADRFARRPKPPSRCFSQICPSSPPKPLSYPSQICSYCEGSIATPARPSAASANPALHPNQPSQSSAATILENPRCCGSISSWS